MHPDLRHLILVNLPFESVEAERQDFQNLHVALRSATHESLSARKFETDMALITLQNIRQGGPFLNIEMTKQAAEQFMMLRNENPGHARALYEYIMQMSSIEFLLDQETSLNVDSQKQKSGKSSTVTLRSFTNLPVPIRPVFYTLPRDIYTHSTQSSDQAKRLIICSLEPTSVDDQRSLKEIAQVSTFSMKPDVDFELLPPVPSPADSILIVPLGKSPMVATQLYTLLREQEQRTIHEVVLIYPQLSVAINNSVDMVRKALREEYNVLCTPVGIPGLGDITSTDDCQIYQTCLEEEIERVKLQYPKYEIDLALSGGRKGMTAMTIFAAQNKQIPYVYHTLIRNEDISEEIEDETTIEILNSPRLSQQTRNARLFLHEYKVEGHNPYAYFTLFRVPVFTANGWQHL